MAEDRIKPGSDCASDDTGDVTAAFEKAIADEAHVKYVLHLYVTGMRPSSQRAIDNLRRLCEEHLSGRYELKIIDIYQQPELAEDAHVIAAPTLVKSLPPPMRHLIGDLSDEGRVLIAMGVELPPTTGQPPK